MYSLPRIHPIHILDLVKCARTNRYLLCNIIGEPTSEKLENKQQRVPTGTSILITSLVDLQDVMYLAFIHFVGLQAGTDPS